MLFEALENRRLLTVNVAFDFGPADAGVPAGAVADVGARYSTHGDYTYGWNADNSTHAFAVNPRLADAAHDSYAVMQGRFGSRTWNLAVPNGTYRVSVIAGSADTDATAAIAAEGHNVVEGSTTAENRWLEGGRTVVVTDGHLTLTSGSSVGANPLDFVTVKTMTTAATSETEGSVPSATTVSWPSTSQWKAAASSPINRFEAHSFSYNGKLYVMGGWADSSFNSTKRVDVYDPAKNTWTRLHDMQAPETHAGAALDVAHGVAYFVGGHRGKYPSTPSNELWKYTIATDTWTKLSATLPYKMGANSVQIINNKLYSFGGNYADRKTNDPDMFELDLGNVAAGFKKIGSLPQPRDHLASVVIGGKIYALGGEFGHDVKHLQQNLLQVYDPATNKWSYLANAPAKKSHAEGSTFVLNGKIIWAAGQIDTSRKQQPTSSVYQYDPSTNKWSTLSSLPAARQGTQVAKVGNYFVYTTGGIQTNQPQKNTWVVKIS